MLCDARLPWGPGVAREGDEASRTDRGLLAGVVAGDRRAARPAGRADDATPRADRAGAIPTARARAGETPGGRGATPRPPRARPGRRGERRPRGRAAAPAAGRAAG